MPQEKLTRVTLSIFMLASTEVNDTPGMPVTRESIACKLTYVACVNPGGWAPALAVQ